MKLTFFNDKEKCGKSILTLLTAKALAEMLSRTDNQINVYIFDTAHSVKNSLVAKKNEEQEAIELIEDKKLYVEYASSLEDFELKEKELNIKEEDIVFFDLQEFGEKQLDFISNTNFVFIVSDNPNELESFDREMYAILSKLTKNAHLSSIKKIFLTQNRVSEKEHIISEFEEVNYLQGMGILIDQYHIENLKIYQGSIPKAAQQFAIEVWKEMNNQEKQLII